MDILPFPSSSKSTSGETPGTPPPTTVEKLLGIGPHMEEWKKARRQQRKAYELQKRQLLEQQRRQDKDFREQLDKIREREYAQRGIRDLARNYGKHSKQELADPRIKNAARSFEKIEAKMMKSNRLQRKEALHQIKKDYTNRVKEISRELRAPQRRQAPGTFSIGGHFFGSDKNRRRAA